MGTVHPIERLRYVARLGADRPDVIAREAAGALLVCAHSPAELVVAGRRLLDHHPAAGPLWWVVSVALTAPDPHQAVRDALEALETDTTPARAQYLVGEEAPGTVVTVEAWALGETGALVGPVDGAAARRQRSRGGPVWVVAGVGRTLPPPVWSVVMSRVEAMLEGGQVSLLPPGDIDAVIGPQGRTGFAEACRPVDFPIAPELLGRR